MAVFTLLSAVAFAAPRPRDLEAAVAVERSLEAVADAAVPAVVHVRTEKGHRVAPELQELFLAYGLPAVPWADDTAEREASGSGVIISADGRVITNHHVVEGALAVSLELSDQRHLSAHVIATDPRTDLALVQIDGPGPFPFLALGRSADVRVGQLVVAVGNPFDFASSVSMGIVSATGRRGLSSREIQDYIQTDAAVNPGNSGGPLLDLAGDVIGINTAIFAPEADQSAGISFAIPVDMVSRVVAELDAGRSPRRAWIGVVARDAADVEGDATRRGAEIERVWPGSPAEKAGLRRGDTIVGVDDTPLVSAADLSTLILTREVGASLVVRIQRDDAAIDVAVVPSDDRRAVEGLADAPLEAVLWAGMSLVDPVAPWLARFGVAQGGGALVVRVEPGSVAARMGIAAGDRLFEVAGAAITDVSGVPAMLATAPAWTAVRFDRAGTDLYALLPSR